MTTLEIILSILCPILLVLWTISARCSHYWRTLCEFYWHDCHANRRRSHKVDLSPCIHHASSKRTGLSTHRLT